MRFSILGPLEVERDDQAIRLGGPKQRLVLAHLLIRPNEVVSADTLIDEVWGDEPPDAARPSLHAYVSHLRQAVGPERLAGRPPGYVLRVAPDELDAARFERLLAQGRRRLAFDPAGAAAVLREALRLWRGAPLSDLAAELSLRPEVERLSDLRLGALEDCLEAELSLGRHAELVPEIERLVDDNPLRERFSAQLMLALYRSGRQADALDAYHRLRRALDEELGLEPSPAVEELQRLILTHDPGLALRGEPLRGYRIVEPIGAGGHGVVYRAIEPHTAREVAIKVLEPRVANQPDFVRRFDTESHRIARLEQVHIVPLLDWWREPDAAYLVMRLMVGGSLRERLARGEIGSPSALKWTEQLGAALAAAHRDGVVHGDIRPANVLLDGDDNAYLADFAIAFDPARQNHQQGAPVEVRYLAPERRSGEPPSETADVYAFGVLLGDLFRGMMGGQDGGNLRAALERATAADPAIRFRDPADLAAAVRRGLLAPDRSLPGNDGVEPSRNPYKGLRPFEEQDAPDFFGREELVNALLGRFGEEGPASRLLAIVGPSGSGKSSVVSAGLLPALRAGALADSAAWFVAAMTPGDRPFDKLEAALLGVAVGTPIAVADLLEEAGGLRPAVERILPPGAALLLIIDQFEELFTLVEDEELRQRFLGLLAATVSDPESQIRIVVTLRADFYDRPLHHERFGRQLADRTHTVLPMSPEELERSVTEPAARVGLRLEPGLAARVVSEMAQQPGALPLLQFAMSELWENREGSRLSLHAYESSGGIAGAVGRRAEQVVGGLRPGAQETARQLFLRLVELGEGTPDTGRRVRYSELLALDGEGERIEAVVDSFARYRLLLLDRDPETRERTVELAHEALLLVWPRLRQWIDEARGDVRQQRRLAAAATQWQEAGRDASFLLAGSRLAQADQWAAATSVTLNRVEREFLEASTAERDRLAEQEARRRANELNLERRAITRLRALVIVLALAALASGALSVFALAESARAEREARTSFARELAAAALTNLEVDPELGVLLALEAVDATRSADGTVLREAEEALRRTTKRLRLTRTVAEGNGRLAVSQDGTRFATTGADGTVTVRDAVTAAELLTLTAHEGGATAVAFSPSAELIATAGADATIRLWDATSGEETDRWSAPSGRLSHLAFDPDGRWLVADDDADGRPPLVLEVSSGREVTGLGTDDLTYVAFSPDGSLIAGGTGGSSPTARIVDLATGDVTVLEGHVWGIYSVAFSPDGKQLATASNDGTARIWDVRSGTQVAALYGHAGNVWAVDWSPDGRRVATGGSDGTARLWNPQTGQALLTLAGHAGAIRDIAFANGGDRLITTGDDGTTRVWDVTVGGARDWLTVPAASLIFVGVAFSPNGATFAAPAEPTGVWLWDSRTGERLRSFASETKLTSVAFSPDGRLLAGTSDLTFEPLVWDVESGDLLFTLAGHSDAVRAVAFSPDSRRIATGSWDGTAAVWDASTGSRIALLPHPDSGGILDVGFTPDGSLVVTGGDDGSVTMWNAETFEKERVVRAHDAGVSGIAFGPDGLMATAGIDATANVWRLDAADSPILTLRGHSGPVSQVAISPDGSRIATAGEDGLAKVWDVASGRELLALYGHELVLYGVDFSPDGRLLATGSADGTVALHVLPIDEFVAIARGRVTRTFTDLECRVYLHAESCLTTQDR